MHNCTLDSFNLLAEEVYKRYMTTEAYLKTLALAESSLSDNLESLVLRELQFFNIDDTSSHEPQQENSDQLLGNLVLYMRDTFWYLEFASAVPEGDIGRVFEIIKVDICDQYSPATN